MNADPSRLIPQKLAANLKLLVVFLTVRVLKIINSKSSRSFEMELLQVFQPNVSFLTRFSQKVKIAGILHMLM